MIHPDILNKSEETSEEDNIGDRTDKTGEELSDPEEDEAGKAKEESNDWTWSTQGGETSEEDEIDDIHDKTEGERRDHGEGEDRKSKEESSDLTLFTQNDATPDEKELEEMLNELEKGAKTESPYRNEIYNASNESNKASLLEDY